jgi:glycosyltransferase involved in cell wall biosynthesis
VNGKYDLVLHIPSLQGGGAERVAVELARYLADKKFKVAFFVYHEEHDYRIPDGIDIFKASGKSHIARILEFRSFLKKLQTPIVISFLPYANLISAFSRFLIPSLKRLIVSEHTSYSVLKPREIKQRFKIALAMFMYRKSDAIVAVSNGVANELKMRVGRREAKKISVIYNPCLVLPAEVETLVKGTRQSKVILAVGRLVDMKGFDTLIRAFSRVSVDCEDLTLRIVGEGNARRKLEALIDGLGLADVVSMPGFSEEISSEYRNADLFVCSSRAEGFGNVLVEALSAGMSVVATDCPFGPREILDSGRFGELVPVDDEEALAAAMMRALRKPANPRTQIQRAADFSLEKIGAQYLSVIDPR